jgi:Big-like domain-containing protein
VRCAPVLLLLIALLVAAPASGKPRRVLHVACASSTHDGRLRYVTVARACRRAERAVRFVSAVQTCVGVHGVLRRSSRCVRRRALVLAGERRRVLCVSRRTHLLHVWRRRRRREFTVIVPARPAVGPATPGLQAPPTTSSTPTSTTLTTTTPTTPTTDTPPPPPPPIARADEATTDEDTAIVLRVLDNDAGTEVVDVDASATTGGVTVNPDGTIAYDPRGRFDALGPTELATDTFTYRAQDSDGRSEAVTVLLTVTGVDDASVLRVEDEPLTYDTAADPVAVGPTLTLTDVDTRVLSRATVTLSGGEGRLEFADGDGIAGSWDAGTLTLGGEATVARYEAALRSVLFGTAALVPSGTRRIAFDVSGQAAARDVVVHHLNVAPVAAADVVEGAAGNTALDVDASVLDNDGDADSPHAALTATAVSPTPSGARVAMRADGTFTYVPPVGFTGADSFDYALHDNDDAHPLTATGTVTVHVGGPVTWFVDAGAAPGGDGRSDAPFATLAPLTMGGSADALDGAGDRILLAGGVYGGGIVLEPNQKLLGQGAANAVIDVTGAPAVTLAGGVDIQHVDLRATGAPAVLGTGVGSATIGAPSTISGVALDGGAGTVSIGSAIAASAGHSVSIANRTGGTVSISGAVSDSGTGIDLRSNAGATIGFGNRLTIASFTASGGGTVTATGAGSTTSGVDMRNTSIGAAGVRFQNASGAITLNATGRSGGLLVNGGATGPIALTDTSKVSLNNVRAPSITGSSVHGFTMTGSTVDGTAAIGDVDGAVTVASNHAGSIEIDNGVGTISALSVTNNVTPSLRLALAAGADVMSGAIRANTAGAIALTGAGGFGTLGALALANNTAPITATLSHGNVAISENTSPGITIDATGPGAAAFEVAANEVDGPQGIGITTDAGTIDAQIMRNLVRGGGSIGVQAGADTRVRVVGNGVTGGDVQLSGDPLCADVATNGAAHILLSTTHGFGIAGITPDPANATTARAFIAAANPDTPTAQVTGPQFTSCELPF